MLYQRLDGVDYEVYTNESGLHLSKGTDFAGDIIIFYTAQTKYCVTKVI